MGKLDDKFETKLTAVFSESGKVGRNATFRTYPNYQVSSSGVVSLGTPKDYVVRSTALIRNTKNKDGELKRSVNGYVIVGPNLPFDPALPRTSLIENGQEWLVERVLDIVPQERIVARQIFVEGPA